MVLVLGQQFNKIGSDSDKPDLIKGSAGREGGPYADQYRSLWRFDIKYPDRIETGGYEELALYLYEIFREYPLQSSGFKPGIRCIDLYQMSG